MVIIRQPWSTNNQLVGVDREVRGLERLRSFGVVGIELLTWATSEWTEQLAHHLPYDHDIALIMFQYNLAAATPQNSTSVELVRNNYTERNLNGHSASPGFLVDRAGTTVETQQLLYSVPPNTVHSLRSATVRYLVPQINVMRWKVKYTSIIQALYNLWLDR